VGRAGSCGYVDDRVTPVRKLTGIHAMMQRDMSEARAHHERIVGLLDSLTDAERLFIETVGQQTAQPLERARLYEAYREWCGRNGRMAVSSQSFVPRVRQVLRDENAAGRALPGPFTQAARNRCFKYR